MNKIMSNIDHEGKIVLKRRHCRASPHGSGVKNPPSNAGDTGLIPDPGRSHIPQGKKPCATTIEPVL